MWEKQLIRSEAEYYMWSSFPCYNRVIWSFEFQSLMDLHQLNVYFIYIYIYKQTTLINLTYWFIINNWFVNGFEFDTHFIIHTCTCARSLTRPLYFSLQSNCYSTLLYWEQRMISKLFFIFYNNEQQRLWLYNNYMYLYLCIIYPSIHFIQV